MSGKPVQVFGTKSDFGTQKALRFFKERRIDVHFVDLKQRAASKGELRRFVQKFGVDAVLDRDSRRFRARGLHAAAYGDERWLEILEEEPLVLRIPLVRWDRHLSVGLDEDAWRGWVEAG